MRAKAAYYPPGSARRLPVDLEFGEDGFLTLRGVDREFRCRLGEVTISSRLGDTPRHLRFPDGGACEVEDNDTVDAVLERDGTDGGRRALHFLESRYRFALLALGVTVAITWAAIDFGIPAIAREVALALPAEVERAIGRDGLRALDRSLFSPSTIEPDRRAALGARFATLSDGLGRGLVPVLEFRGGGRIGANAFALPAGVVVVTDELVELMDDENATLAVLAHELGHVHHRHILRQLLQSSMTALLVASVFGDLSSVAGLSATVPTFLVEQKYSRAFEREADAFARTLLAANGIPASRLADALERLEADLGGPAGLPAYLSSHPDTTERIRAIRSAQR